MTPSLDRFAVGLADPQEREPGVICKCACGCGETIVEGYESIFWDDMWFYEFSCFMKFQGAEWKIPGAGY